MCKKFAETQLGCLSRNVGCVRSGVNIQIITEKSLKGRRISWKNSARACGPENEGQSSRYRHRRGYLGLADPNRMRGMCHWPRNGTHRCLRGPPPLHGASAAPEARFRSHLSALLSQLHRGFFRAQIRPLANTFTIN